jgi:hypothetical protein
VLKRSSHLSGGTEETHKKYNQDSRFLCRNFNPGHPKSEAGPLTAIFGQTVRVYFYEFDGVLP